ncbi:K+/H+ antiporter subunit F [Zwartia vadi]|uniref:K+/H+ antiporter subunit F n=1 Tax=Zwartia vadi TaxID=3058168 RepID=UPI0025B522E4|nr:K+/H+ antiporter subunit F [Zwartia vadi]MDN3988722.1 K+/H+ antiporter subunit F [Zwartia vadi]
MLEISIKIALVAIGLSMALTLYRLIKGPDAPDRILALDTLYVNAVALLIVLGIYDGSSIYFEAALLIALIGFVATVALARFIARGDVMD